VRTATALIACLLAAAAVAGCTSVSRAPMRRPAAAPAAVRAPARQLGIDVDFYDYAGLNVQQAAAADVAYVRRLHANSMSVSFPFFMTGPDADSVHATAATPSPEALATFAVAAERAGLYFSVRPLLDQSSLDVKGGRVRWRPADPAAWFASYASFLRPYAQMAQREHIGEFITGAEFDEFGNSPYWAGLDTYLRRFYRGTLGYSDNWDISVANAVSQAGVAQLVDAYKPVYLPSGASLAALTAAWEAYLGSQPRGIVLSEVGIAAQDGAYRNPYDFVSNGTPLVPAIQVNWLTAACDAVAGEQDGGLYFWSIAVGQNFDVPPGRSDPASFADGPGARAIAACFERIG